MSLSLTDSKTYVAGILGGAGNTNVIADALSAMKSAYEEMLHRNNWTHLRLDTSQSFTVVSSASSGVATLTTAVTDGFKNVLVGMTVTHANIPASTTVSSIESTTSLTLSAVTTGAISAASVTFGGTIPIIAGTDSYTLPAPFWKPYDCRLVSTQLYPLAYIPPNKYDSISYDQTTQGSVVAYTIYTSVSFDATGTQQTKIKFIRVPSAADVALLKYYRLPDFTGTNMDVPDSYLYTFLDLARVHLLRSKDAASKRLPILIRDVEQRIARAISADREEGGDDQWTSFNSPIDLDTGGIFTGEFWPHGDVVWGRGW